MLCPYNTRAVVALSGADAGQVLQGLITNDIALLNQHPLLYTAWLSAQGRYQFDFFLFKKDSVYYALVETARVADFTKLLKLYKLRNQMTIQDMSAEFLVYVDLAAKSHSDAFFQAKDPRHPDLGSIIVMPKNTALEATANPSEHQNQRYQLGLAEGSEELKLQKSVILEYHFDAMNALSWTKGCYMGQELMARTKHRGGIHKEAMGFKLANPTETLGTDIFCKDTKVGSLLCHTQSHGLALIRHEHKDLLQTHQFKARDDLGNTLQLIPSPLSTFFNS